MSGGWKYHFRQKKKCFLALVQVLKNVFRQSIKKQKINNYDTRKIQQTCTE